MPEPVERTLEPFLSETFSRDPALPERRKIPAPEADLSAEGPRRFKPSVASGGLLLGWLRR